MPLKGKHVDIKSIKARLLSVKIPWPVTKYPKREISNLRDLVARLQIRTTPARGTIFVCFD
jgi:hypothetical protein